jgi:leader peptidase (prepilin peptidase)/N-methyltransferase
MNHFSPPINLSNYCQSIIIFIVGLCLGSFVNVCIWRMPKKKSIIYPFSSCPKCGNYLRWYENIPLLSYLFLKGRCHHCNEKISVQYPLVELLSGLIFLLIYLKFSFSIQLFFVLILSIFLLIASGIDYFHRIVPNKLTYSLIIIGLSLSFSNPFLEFPHFISDIIYHQLQFTRFFYALSSMFIASGFLYFIGLLGEKIFKKEAMGGGDVKLLAGIGTFVGIKNIFWIIFLASTIGGITGLIKILYRKLIKRDNRLSSDAVVQNLTFASDDDTLIPFAPYLSIATFITLLFVN